MMEWSKLQVFRALAPLAIALAACNPNAEGQIPCVEDVSCPNDYPVCGPAGKCISGSSTAAASVAVVGADGHAATDVVSGTVRMLVSARAATGVKSVKLASGSVSFPASATAAAPPVYAFDVDTTGLADGDATLTATVTAGNDSTGTATSTLHVSNAKPVITSFTIAGGASATVTSGTSVAISAAFTGGTGTITSSAGGSVSVTSGASVLVSPDAAGTFKLRVTSPSGVTVTSGSAGQPADVAVAAVVAPVSFTGTFSVNPSQIAQGQTGTFVFTAPAFGPSVTSAQITDGTIAPVSIASGGTANVPIPTTNGATTSLAYTLTLKNGATAPDTVSIPLVVKVNQALPTISSFTFQSTGTAAATFNPGDDVVLAHTYDAKGGTAFINGVITAGAATTTVPNIQASTTFRLTVTNLDGASVHQDVTATVNAKVNAFTAGTTQAASGASATIASGATTKLFATFGGSGASGNAPATLSCSPSCNATLSSTSIGSGGNVTVTGSTAGALTYTLTVTPSSGPAATANVTVNVIPPATATSLIAGSTVIHQGGSTSLTPTFSFGGAVVPGAATITGSDGSTYSGLSSGTAIQVAPAASATYTLHVSSAAGVAAATTPSVTVDVEPGTWSVLNSSTFTKRIGATVTALANGKVLIAGGADDTGTPLGTADVCDATGACVPTTNQMSVPRAYHTATLVPAGAASNAGKVLLAGGFTAQDGALQAPKTPTNTADFYDPATNSFSSTTAITTGSVPTARARHVAVLLDATGTILVAGGTSDAGTTILSSAIKYLSGGAPPTTANTSNAMSLARMSFTGTLLGSGSVLIVGGKTAAAAADYNAELFNPGVGSGTFTTAGAGTLPNSGCPGACVGEDKRGHTAVVIGGVGPHFGDVLISAGVTGTSLGTASATQFLWSGGTFTAVPSLSQARSRHAASVLPLGDVLICGGTSTGSNTLASCERYDASSGLGTVFPTAPMVEARKDFGLASITISSVVEILAAGTPGFPTNAYAETYNPD